MPVRWRVCFRFHRHAWVAYHITGSGASFSVPHTIYKMSILEGGFRECHRQHDPQSQNNEGKLWLCFAMPIQSTFTDAVGTVVLILLLHVRPSGLRQGPGPPCRPSSCLPRVVYES